MERSIQRVHSTLGLKRSERDHCLYTATSKKCRLYLLLYVDDIIIAGQDETQMQEIVDALKSKFAMTDIGEIGSFLGVKIEKTLRGLFLSQRAYMEKNACSLWNDGVQSF